VLAEALAARDGAELSLDPRLLELDFGAWEGSRWDAVPRSGIDAWAADVIHYAPGNGESLSLLWSRVQEFRRQLGDPRCSVAVVSHHGPLRALAAQFAGESPALMFTRQWAWGCVKPIDLDPLPSGG
jgi:alpha-ribazole phosphatase